MTPEQLENVFRVTGRACWEWRKRAVAGTLPPVTFQRPGLRGVQGTYLGVLFPNWMLPDELVATGGGGQRLLTFENPTILRWRPWLYPFEPQAQFWESDLYRLFEEPRDEWQQFAELAHGAPFVNFAGHWYPTDVETHGLLGLFVDRYCRQVFDYVEERRSTLYPRSGITFQVDIIGERFQTWNDFQFRTVRLETVEKVYPVVIEHRWSMPGPESPQLPQCRVIVHKLRGGCCPCC